MRFQIKAAERATAKECVFSLTGRDAEEVRAKANTMGYLVAEVTPQPSRFGFVWLLTGIALVTVAVLIVASLTTGSKRQGRSSVNDPTNDEVERKATGDVTTPEAPRFGGRELSEWIVDTTDKDVETRRKALNALNSIGSDGGQRVGEAIKSLTRDTNPLIRLIAAKSVWKSSRDAGTVADVYAGIVIDRNLPIELRSTTFAELVGVFVEVGKWPDSGPKTLAMVQLSTHATAPLTDWALKLSDRSFKTMSTEELELAKSILELSEKTDLRVKAK